jgi:hypothetical protein
MKELNRDLTGLMLVAIVVVFSCGGGLAEAYYGKATIVAKSGGDYANPVAAMAAIKTWCGIPSATNPCLIKILPGVYDLGTQNLVMKQYVDIEGSGEKTTVLYRAVPAPTTESSPDPTAGAVNGASNAELRFLTVKSRNIPAIFNKNASPNLTHITVSATGDNPSDCYGVYNTSASPKMTDATISATCVTMHRNLGVYSANASSARMENVVVSASGAIANYGVYNVNSSPLMVNVAVDVRSGEGNTAIVNQSSSPRMINVTASASQAAYGTTGIWNINSSPEMLNVSASASAGVADGIYNQLSSPIMTNVTATAAGGSSNTGITNLNSSPIMTNVTASAISGEYADGADAIYNESSTPVMTNVIASATGAALSNSGITNIESNSVLTNVTASASGEASVGMSIENPSAGPHIVIIDRSSFQGSTSIDNDPGFILKIGASKLDGPATTQGTYQCVGSYRGNYVPLNQTCH